MWTFALCESPIPITEENETRFYEECLKRSDTIRMAIIADGMYVGNIFIDNIENGEGEMHIHIFNPFYWGKGVGKKATVLFIRHLLEHTGVRKIYQYINHCQLRNMSIAKDCGFIENGTKKNRTDVIRFELTAS